MGRVREDELTTFKNQYNAEDEADGSTDGCTGLLKEGNFVKNFELGDNGTHKNVH